MSLTGKKLQNSSKLEESISSEITKEIKMPEEPEKSTFTIAETDSKIVLYTGYDGTWGQGIRRGKLYAVPATTNIVAICIELKHEITEAKERANKIKYECKTKDRIITVHHILNRDPGLLIILENIQETYISYLSKVNISVELIKTEIQEVAEVIYKVHNAGLKIGTIHEKSIIVCRNGNKEIYVKFNVFFTASEKELLPFQSPEQLSGNVKNSEKSIVFNFTCYVYFAFTGQHLFRNGFKLKKQKNLDWYLSTKFEILKKKCDFLNLDDTVCLEKLVKEGTKIDPEQRSTMEQIAKHPFFIQTDHNEILIKRSKQFLKIEKNTEIVRKNIRAEFDEKLKQYDGWMDDKDINKKLLQHFPNETYQNTAYGMLVYVRDFIEHVGDNNHVELQRYLDESKNHKLFGEKRGSFVLDLHKFVKDHFPEETKRKLFSRIKSLF